MPSRGLKPIGVEANSFRLRTHPFMRVPINCTFDSTLIGPSFLALGSNGFQSQWNNSTATKNEQAWLEILFFCIFQNSSTLRHQKVLEKDLTLTHDAYYCRLIQVTGKYGSHYDKTARKCSAFTAARQIKRKTAFLLRILTFSAAHRLAPIWLRTMFTYSVLCCTSWLEKCVLLSRM